ncbi:MAG: type II secretion system protein M [Maricaulis sp.]|jgi:general secretion pathway protein M|uniref:type II secretion system protein M n=1 Tax=Maricaulis sp. TaxID=1486257 RepID=UPI001B2DF385|nr:type II secretion system protein M [Maricaulis sp.]MBO6728579.1 type II secretion system protein M [Maricaulis sp.]MBO6845919.1 type II secretion system protein M [Maricaulis sp.]MBO6876205.1 type II secretion system protein M [Maricaulis sp.]
MNPVLQMLQSYWTDRTPREQILYAVMGGLLCVLLLSVAVIQPLQSFHARAQTDYAASMRLYRSIQQDVATVRDLRAGSQVQAGSQQSIRSIVGSLALGEGIAIARMIPGDDGSLAVTVERADTAVVMRWLVNLEERYGIRVASSTLDRHETGMTQASVVLRRGGGS